MGGSGRAASASQAFFRRLPAKPLGCVKEPVMKRSRCVITWLITSVWLASSASAVEPARQFLDALRARQYFDVALDYLDIMATHPLAPVDLKETLDYEKGAILIEASRFQKDVAIRDKQINDAQLFLNQFIKEHAKHRLASAARNQLGTLMIERAR